MSNTDLEPRESASQEATENGTGVKWGAGVNAEPARKPKELPRKTAPSIVAGNHNI